MQIRPLLKRQAPREGECARRVLGRPAWAGRAPRPRLLRDERFAGALLRQRPSFSSSSVGFPAARLEGAQRRRLAHTALLRQTLRPACLRCWAWVAALLQSGPPWVSSACIPLWKWPGDSPVLLPKL